MLGSGEDLQALVQHEEAQKHSEHDLVKEVEEIEAVALHACSGNFGVSCLAVCAQVAGVNVAESQLAQITSAFAQAEVQLEGAKATLTQAESALAQAENELAKKTELSARGQQLVSKIEIERLENTVAQRRGGVQAAQANITAAETQISDVLPAQRESAQRQLEQAS